MAATPRNAALPAAAPVRIDLAAVTRAFPGRPSVAELAAGVKAGDAKAIAYVNERHHLVRLAATTTFSAKWGTVSGFRPMTSTTASCVRVRRADGGRSPGRSPRRAASSSSASRGDPHEPGGDEPPLAAPLYALAACLHLLDPRLAESVERLADRTAA